MPIDYTTPVGQVRLLIADVNEGAFLLTDAMLEGYLALNGVSADETAPASWSVKRAAADALDAIATSEVLVSKAIKTLDLSTDGAKVAAELRAQAGARRKAADEEEAAVEDGFFGVVEFHPYPSRGPELTERAWI
jgi:hypothetical protein